jgi:hypothetical protein
MKISWFR